LKYDSRVSLDLAEMSYSADVYLFLIKASRDILKDWL